MNDTTKNHKRHTNSPYRNITTCAECKKIVAKMNEGRAK